MGWVGIGVLDPNEAGEDGLEASGEGDGGRLETSFVCRGPRASFEISTYSDGGALGLKSNTREASPGAS